MNKDLERFKSIAPDKQALFLFNALSTHYRHIVLLDTTLLNQQSGALLDDLIIALRAPLQRAHRNLLARCFVTILKRIDRGPFEVTNKIMALLKADDKVKLAAVVALQHIFEHVGSQIVALAPELVSVLSKTKTASPSLKAASLRAISAALKVNSAETALKYVRTCVGDKSTLVHATALDCLSVLIQTAGVDENVAMSMILKSRHTKSAARCMASLYIGICDNRVSEMFKNLAELYNKNTRERSVVALTYLEIFKRMGKSWLAANHEIILLSVLNDLQLTPLDDYSSALTRKHVRFLLNFLCDTLEQEGQVSCVKRIIAHLQTAPSRHILISSLSQITYLLDHLGFSPELEYDTLFFLAAHPIPDVQLAAARAIKAVVSNNPLLLTEMFNNLFTRLREEQSNDSVGLSVAIATLLETGASLPLYIDIEAAARSVLQFTEKSLKDNPVVGANLLEALQTLGAAYVRPHLTQFMLLWRGHLRSVLAFLKHCRVLCTPDVLKRLSTVILAAKEDPAALACLIELDSLGGLEADVASLALDAMLKHKSEPHIVVSIWQCADNIAYGVALGALDEPSMENLDEIPILYDFTPPQHARLAQDAIELLARVYPRQSRAVQESIIAQMSTALALKGPRRIAVQLNCLLLLEKIVHDVPGIVDILIEALASTDAKVRLLAARSFGKLKRVNDLVDLIVKDREPHARAGYSLALGFIHQALGGIAAQGHLKTIINVLTSLANDPHPVVHHYAISALHLTIESSGVNFTHTNDTLSLLLRLYVACLDPEAGSTIVSNLAFGLDTIHLLALCADDLINIIGPDLETNATARELLLKFVGELLAEQDSQLIADGLICTQHLALFTKQIDLTTYIVNLHMHLRASDGPIRLATVDGLYQLMRKDASEVIRHSSISSRFDTALWLLLNDKPDWQTVKDIIRAWLAQTKHEHNYWLELFQQILIRQRLSEKVATAVIIEAEADEGSALGVTAESKDEQLRWQTRLFALQCLHDLVLSLSPETLALRIGDLVRMAFSASTSHITALQLAGLYFLRDIIVHFKDIHDPDFPDSALLEQHQAQLGSALTPSFSTDCSPEVSALAIHVCAEFIASGIVEDVERMGRILRLLTNALEPRPGTENARAMIKISVLSAWAELQISSSKQEYLIQVVRPHLRDLLPAWLDALKEFAHIKYEEKRPSTYYDRAWLNFVHAISCLVEADRDLVFSALDNREIDYRGEPAAFFMILFGVCFEALAQGNANIRILYALQSILKPAVCGDIIYTEPIFTEITDLLGRLLLTEGPAAQIIIVDVIAETAHNLTDVDQLFDLARLTILPLTIVFRWDSDNRPTKPNASLPKLARTCLTHFVKLAELFPDVIKVDLYNAMFHVFGNVFSDHPSIIPAVLPAFKDFTANVAKAGAKLSTGILLKQIFHHSGNNSIMASTILVIALDIPSSMIEEYCTRICSESSKTSTWAIRSILVSQDPRLMPFQKYLVLTLSQRSDLSLLFDFVENQPVDGLPFIIPLVLKVKTNQYNSRLVRLIAADETRARAYLESLPLDQKTYLQQMLAPKKEESVPSINLTAFA